METDKTAFTDKLRIIDDGDGWHYNIVETDEKTGAALMRCDGCGRMLIVSEFTPPQTEAGVEPLQPQEQAPTESDQTEPKSGFVSASRNKRRRSKTPPQG